MNKNTEKHEENHMGGENLGPRPLILIAIL